MSLAKKILGNTAAQVFGRLATALLAIIVVKILTNYLGTSQYGQYMTIYEILAFFGALADFGIFTIVIREMAREKEKEDLIFGNALTFRAVSISVMMIVASGLLFFIPQYSGTVIPVGVSIAALSTFFIIASGTLSAALQVRFQMHLSAFALVVGKILSVVLIVFITQFFFPYRPKDAFFWILWAGTAGGLLTFVMTFFFARRVFSLRFLCDKKIIFHLVREAAPFAVALTLSTLYLRMDTLLLSFLLPQSDDGVCAVKFCGDLEVGKYSVAARILEITLMVPISFMNSVLPALMARLKKTTTEVAFLLQNAFLFLLVTGVATGTILFVLAPDIIRLISSEHYLATTNASGSDTALSLLAVMIPMAFLSLFFGFLLIATNHQKKLITINLVAALINLGLNILLLPRFGFIAAAMTSVLAEIFMLAMMFYFSRRYLSFPLPGKKIILLFSSAFVSGGITLFLRGLFQNFFLGFFFAFLFFFVFFLGALFLSGVVNREMVVRVLRR